MKILLKGALLVIYIAALSMALFGPFNDIVWGYWTVIFLMMHIILHGTVGLDEIHKAFMDY